MLTQTQKLEYVTNGYNKCPICKSTDIEAGEFEVDGTNMTNDCVCGHCDASWKDRYTLQSVTLIKGGNLGIDKLNDLQTERYLDHAQACPVCQGNQLAVDDPEVDGNTGSAEADCTQCNAVWQDGYKLSDVEILSGGIYEHTLTDEEAEA